MLKQIGKNDCKAIKTEKTCAFDITFQLSFQDMLIFYLIVASV